MMGIQACWVLYLPRLAVYKRDLQFLIDYTFQIFEHCFYFQKHITFRQ